MVIRGALDASPAIATVNRPERKTPKMLGMNPAMRLRNQKDPRSVFARAVGCPEYPKSLTPETHVIAAVARAERPLKRRMNRLSGTVFMEG